MLNILASCIRIQSWQLDVIGKILVELLIFRCEWFGLDEQTNKTKWIWHKEELHTVLCGTLLTLPFHPINHCWAALPHTHHVFESRALKKLHKHKHKQSGNNKSKCMHSLTVQIQIQKSFAGILSPITHGMKRIKRMKKPAEWSRMKLNRSRTVQSRDEYRNRNRSRNKIDTCDYIHVQCLMRYNMQ